VFVLPNPSGRNAHFSYAEMLHAFRALRRQLRARPSRAAGA
jgi:G:T/U-mismatch repair DNA glycosylase